MPDSVPAVPDSVPDSVRAAGSACPHATLGAFSAEYLDDPYARFATARAETPVFFDDELGHYVVTRHHDVEAVFRDAETFSAANAQDPVFALHEETLRRLADVGFRRIRTMSNLDGPEHARIRQHNQVGFSPRRLRGLEPVVRDTASALIEAMAGGSPTRQADLVASVAFPLPAGIIFALLGFPAEDTEQLKAWCGDRMSFSWGRPSAEAQAKIADDMVAYWSYCEAHVARRLRDPADDFTSDLLAVHRGDESALSLAEIAHVIYGMSFAGHETTTNLIANTLRRVLEAGLWPTLAADRAKIARAVDEGLRFDTSVLTWRRVAAVDARIGAVDVPAGAKLLLVLGSANRDEEVFAEAGRFDIDRSESARHLSFGFGKHYCLGATLAKLEVSAVLDLLLTRFPTLELAPQGPLEFHPNVSFRGPRRLLVRR